MRSVFHTKVEFGFKGTITIPFIRGNNHIDMLYIKSATLFILMYVLLTICHDEAKVRSHHCTLVKILSRHSGDHDWSQRIGYEENRDLSIRVWKISQHWSMENQRVMMMFPV